MGEKEQLVIVGETEALRAMWCLDDARARTQEALKGMEPSLVDWQADHINHQHTIGTVLYHIAAIELDWLMEEILEGQLLDDPVWEMFPYDVRDENGLLTIVTGHSYDWHWQRLDKVRQILRETITPMTTDEFRRKRVLESYDVTPAWVMHHLAQHEAEHRGELMMLRTLAESVKT